MHRALIREDALCAPTVGTFYPSLRQGDRVEPGVRIGRLRRLMRWRDVLAPPDTPRGFAEDVLAPYTAVEYGTPLLRVRAAEPERAEERPEEDASRARTLLRAAMEGVLYQRPNPDARPFAPPGTRVDVHDIIALVEVMKTFTPIRSPIRGVLRRWLVKDGGAVPVGAPLAEIEPETTSEHSRG